MVVFDVVQGRANILERSQPFGRCCRFEQEQKVAVAEQPKPTAVKPEAPKSEQPKA